MDPLLITAIMFGSMLLLMATGLPISFSLGSVAVAAGYLLWGPMSMELLYYSVLDVMRNFILIAIPLFIFMGLVLHESGMAQDLFDTVYLWSGRVRGALGMGTVAICAIIAAMVGISGAATLSMGVIALPAMLNRKYDKHIAIGLVQAGGALGFLIPPSMMMIMYAFLSGVSVGQLFAGGILPGLMLALFYITYIGVRCLIQPQMGPALPLEERVCFRQKLTALKVLILPTILIVSVMGFIFSGVTSPTEAAAVGAFGALVVAAIKKKVTWAVIKKASLVTLELSSFTAWIIVAAVIFSKVYTGLGATALIKSYILGMRVSPWLILIMMQLSFFALGMFLDDIAILFMCMPIYIPIIKGLGFDPLWFAILYIVNMQMAFLTPPYGVNLFYMKAIAPPGVTMGDIYKSVIPFVMLQAVGLAVLMLFPEIVLWLPRVMFGG